ncbi:PRC-barrel domain-containing protein [Streptomyces sp. C10-9-1]|uniref:PRC-barrel domain-containing protein n=1 Tax=Streptomyces sp. C10-9-1 TaxID=1859285 RepID=UPI0021116ED7|nr:PRC-barrel domain-containing protein [Streptomyces sp. C10-9-1]MCQ6553334.1 PRC-barrel domain-containing protein [Streptomyces sp. C10-9-1]
MVRSADIREWRNQEVVDEEGKKIGTLEAVYVDTRSDEPTVITVAMGLPTRRRLTFVPLLDAVAGPGYIRVSYSKNQVKDAPSMGTDDVLPAEDEEAVFTHYGLPYEPGPSGERQLARR